MDRNLAVAPMTTGTTDVTGNRTMWDMLTHWTGIQPSGDFLIYLEDQESPQTLRRVSWEATTSAVWEMRCRLATLGVGDQRAVLLALPNSPLGIVCWLAIGANGGMTHAVDPDSGVLPLVTAIRASQPAAIIAHRSNGATLARALRESEIDSVLLIADDLALTAPLASIEGIGSPSPNPSHTAADMIAGLLPTSGTSGAPKLVEITQRSFVESGERLARNSAHGRGDRFYVCSPFFHVNAQLYGCMPALATGGSIAVVPRFSASRYFDTARHTGATVSSMVAPPMRMALQKAQLRGGRVDAGGLRLIQYGMSMSQADWQAWDELFPQIEMRQVYGQTETVSAVLGGAPWEPDDRRTIGRPFLGVDAVRLVGDDGATVPDGVPGELWVRGQPGKTLMRGYYNNPEATASTLDSEGWLRTGDLMTRNAEGRFAFVGRRMHMIRRAGENLSIYELELMMQSCPLIEDVSIRAEADPVLDTRLVVHIIPAAGFGEQAFLNWCREYVGRRGVPDAIRIHESFPRTGSGRVITRELG